MRHLLMSALIVAAGTVHAAPPPLSPPSPAVVEEAANIVGTMKKNERGPYSTIRWFCNDGTTHPAHPYPCAERGGGRQHAEYSGQRKRLVELGWHVGTVVAALSWDEVWKPDERHQRLREIPLERYLETVDDGWVLRAARHYRGRVQLEDEEKAGRALLLQLLEQPGFLSENFLLARELARVIPHGTPGSDRTRSIRHLAQEIAEADTSFTRLRIEVHSRPSAGTAARVRGWLTGREDLSEEYREKAQRLAHGLDELYGLAGRNTRLGAAADALARYSPAATRLIREAKEASPALHIQRLSQAMQRLRADTSEREPGASLRRLDLLTDLESELRTSALERLDEPLTRRDLLGLASNLLGASWALGLLSPGEREALSGPLEKLLTLADAPASTYAFATRRLSLAAGWAAQTVRYSFAEPLVRYSTLEPMAARFVDDLLRDSVLLPLGELADRLAVDGARSAALGHRVFGEGTSGLHGINPGIARGPLLVLTAEEPNRHVHATENDIVVLTETVTELNPVAGILTLGEGNPLSHVQMLARNLGIPNAAVAPAVLPLLRAHSGEGVLLAVAGDGRVLVESSTGPAKDERKAVEEPQELSKINVPEPDLSQVHPLPLAKLHAGLSGKVVGPKAANLGELNRLFPGRIAPAIALPFGVFAEHSAPARQRLEQAFRLRRAGELDQTQLDAELDAVRETVAGLALSPLLAGELESMMEETLGPAGSYGVFVRSDTNAEDLAAFTGAGLNLTIPHVVGLDRQLAAVPQVWSSIYSRRAMSWRSRILGNPEEVFSSVLLMKSVPSEKSGVLVTADLTGGGPGLTVSVAWGVGGAVDNESAASRVLRPDGSSVVLAEAKAPYQRALAPEGGIVWRPAPAGPVLSDAEMDELRRLAVEVQERYRPIQNEDGNPLPWDVEFGFADGKLWLLQIRPLVQRGQAEADAIVNARLPPAIDTGPVILDAPAVGAAGDQP